MTPSIRSTSALAAAATLLLVAAIQAVEPVHLKPNWTPGATQYVEFTYDNENTDTGSDFGTGERQTHSKLTLGFQCVVEKVDRWGTAKITLTIARVAMSVERENVSVSFDTDAPSEARGMEAFGKKLQSLVGESLAMVVRCDGDIQSIEGTEQLAGKASPDDSDPCRDELAHVRDCLSWEVQYSIWMQYYGYFSFGPLKVGETWTRRVSDMTELDVRYMLECVEDIGSYRHATVTHRGQRDRPPDWENRGSVQVQSGPYSASGSTIIDVDAGRIVSSEETVLQEARARRLDESGNVVWWQVATNTAKHSLVVRSEADRNESKPSRQTGASR